MGDDKDHRDVTSSILDTVRQLRFAPEFRIHLPLNEGSDAAGSADDGVVGAVNSSRPMPTEDTRHTPSRLLAELATCLWYLKTKHFKRSWNEREIDDEDPRVRRALGRVDKAVALLVEHGVELHDPVNARYPQGGEAMMHPIQFVPTAGLTVEVVSDTIVPIVFQGERLIQRGEVFVAVPKEPDCDTGARDERARSETHDSANAAKLRHDETVSPQDALPERDASNQRDESAASSVVEPPIASEMEHPDGGPADSDFQNRD